MQLTIYSGAGSVPDAAATVTPYPNHPVTQAYVQMLGVFIDTMVLCTCTAVIILLADINISGEM
ncbi:MAG: AGCS family alanine or glycine:cation symporter [Paraglaciecola sp.]